jgi:flavin-dependent dehydrogenase
MPRRSNDRDVDVAIIGGGPAGATAAALLASWGRSVVIVHGSSGAPSLAESLPVSTRKLLRFLGLLDLVDSAGFYPNHGNISRWAGQEAVAGTKAAGYHVSRAAFDRLLRRHARSRGARIVEGRARRVELGETATVECVGAGGRRTYRGRFVLDCSGRAGVVASRGLRRMHAGYRTLAVAAEWTCRNWPAQERTLTFVDSYSDGWAWSVPLSDRRRQCTVMIDADRTIVRKAGLGRLYESELAKAVSIETRLAGARQVSPPWACDASLYDCVRAFEGRALLVGDAASFVEPLSSGGVKKALSSAWRAAVVVNTCLDKPDMLSVAADFHDRRERQVFDEYQRHSAAFFRAAAREYDDRFWLARAAPARDRTDDASTISDVDLARDAGVRAAFERLRGAGKLCLAPAPSLRFGRTAVVEGREIVMREAVVVPGMSAPVRFAAGVNLPEVIRIARDRGDVAAILGTYAERVGGVDPRNLLAVLSLLVSRGLLIERGSETA